MAELSNQPMRAMLVVAGTRPEAIKLVPLILALERSELYDPVVLSTGQHEQMVDEIFALAGITVDAHLWVGGARSRLNERVSSLMRRLEDFIIGRYTDLQGEKPTQRARGRRRVSDQRHRPRGHQLGLRRRAGSLPPAHPRRARRGGPAHRGPQPDAVPGGAQPPADHLHRGDALRADRQERGEPGARERVREPDLRDRQHRHRRAVLGRRARRADPRSAGRAGSSRTTGAWSS